MDMLNRCLSKAGNLIIMQGGTLPEALKAQTIEELEYILADWEQGADAEHAHYLKRATREQRNKWEAKVRDGFRCLRCGSSGLNRGGVHSHHVVPKGARGDALYDAVTRKMGSIDAVENLATLCERCHQAWAHAGWRKAAVWLFKKMGVEL